MTTIADIQNKFLDKMESKYKNGNSKRVILAVRLPPSCSAPRLAARLLRHVLRALPTARPARPTGALPRARRR